MRTSNKRVSPLTRLARAASIFISALAIATALPSVHSTAFAQPQAGPQSAMPAANDVKSVLSQFGSFVQHPKYGEVWVPTVTPQGWHPYPACQWVNSKQYGWYFDDRTPWGQIVHHYGRWAHDDQMGWIWIAGNEFSPGWVVWRTSPEWVGWAPMLPDQDVKTIAADDFNSGGFWTFVDAAKFGSGCTPGTVAAASQVPVLLKRTKFVTEFALVGGIGVFVLPPYVIGPLVDINVVVTPWPGWFFIQAAMNWNWMWNNLVVINETIYVACNQPPGGGNNHGPLAVAPANGPPGPHGVPILCPVGASAVGNGCFLADPCGPGLRHSASGSCEPIRLTIVPPLLVPINPTQRCVGLSGLAFRQCLIGSQSGGVSVVTGPKKCAGLSGVALRRCLGSGGTVVLTPLTTGQKIIVHRRLHGQTTGTGTAGVVGGGTLRVKPLIIPRGRLHVQPHTPHFGAAGTSHGTGVFVPHRTLSHGRSMH
jgi:hypothetical protein